MRFFRFILQSVTETKVKAFPKQKQKVFETKRFLLRKHLRNGSVFDTRI